MAGALLACACVWQSGVAAAELAARGSVRGPHLLGLLPMSHSLRSQSRLAAPMDGRAGRHRRAGCILHLQRTRASVQLPRQPARAVLHRAAAAGVRAQVAARGARHGAELFRPLSQRRHRPAHAPAPRTPRRAAAGHTRATQHTETAARHQTRHNSHGAARSHCKVTTTTLNRARTQTHTVTTMSQ